jgi:hypothetical protein
VTAGPDTPSRRRRRIGAFLLFPFPVLAYVAVWLALGRQITNRLGYLLWLLHGPDTIRAMGERFVALIFLVVVVPIALGAAGIGWRVILRRSRRAADAADSLPSPPET